MSVIIVSSACAVALLAHGWLRAADDAPERPVEVWVVLSEPALATLPRDATDQRTALRQRIVLQQNAVMAQLVALGAIETARVQRARNAIAVRLPPAAIEEARRIAGVVGVHAVNHRNRIGD
jgi:hypothetical protein